MANMGSRKGYGVNRTDLDRVSEALRCAGVQFGESVSQPAEYLRDYPEIGRRKVQRVVFETTTLFFDIKGRYLGREYVARDESDYFKPREKE